MVPTAAAITHALHAEGFLPDGEVIAVEEGERFQALATAVFRCRLRYSARGPHSLPETMIVKIYGPAWYERGGLRDLFFFQRIAPALEPPIAPLLYGVIHDPAARTCVVLIEDLAPGYRQVELPLADAWLDAIVDTLADLHAQWWEAPLPGALLEPEDTVMRMAQALPPQGLQANVEAARDATSRFRSRFGSALTEAEAQLLTRLGDRWATRFSERIAHRGLTLLHGDFHLLGNVFLARHPDTASPIKVIDWGQVKRGLGPHDLMFALLSVDAADRRSRDLALLRRYHQRLMARGVAHYGWDQCLWDYRFSLLTNVHQAIFQESLHWFRRTLEVAGLWEAPMLLEGAAEPA
ncbi:hypothetical protein D3C72_559480 [compost metagenome]